MRQRIIGSVLIVEDSPVRIDWFRERLPHAEIVTNPVTAVAALSRRPESVFLDFDLGAANSLGVAQMLADDPPLLCVIHSANEQGAGLLKAILPGALVLPFASFSMEANEIVWKQP
jgi:DNA-binding LytR/AlgR family response regulator